MKKVLVTLEALHTHTHTHTHTEYLLNKINNNTCQKAGVNVRYIKKE